MAAVEAAVALVKKAVQLAGTEAQECLLVTKLQIEGSALELEDLTYRYISEKRLLK